MDLEPHSVDPVIEHTSAEHVEVDASHIGMAVNAQAYGVVAAALGRFDAAAPRRRAGKARVPA